MAEHIQEHGTVMPHGYHRAHIEDTSIAQISISWYNIEHLCRHDLFSHRCRSLRSKPTGTRLSQSTYWSLVSTDWSLRSAYTANHHGLVSRRYRSLSLRSETTCKTKMQGTLILCILAMETARANSPWTPKIMNWRRCTFPPPEGAKGWFENPNSKTGYIFPTVKEMASRHLNYLHDAKLENFQNHTDTANFQSRIYTIRPYTPTITSMSKINKVKLHTVIHTAQESWSFKHRPTLKDKSHTMLRSQI